VVEQQVDSSGNAIGAKRFFIFDGDLLIGEVDAQVSLVK